MKIILDCDLMRHPNSGLYHYCLNLGKNVNELLRQEGYGHISFYVPKEESKSFGADAHHIVERKSFWRELWPPFRNCNILHAPFQSGRLVLNKRKFPGTKILLTIHDLNPLHEGKSLREQTKSLQHTQFLINNSDAIVCISSFCKQDVLENCDVGKRPVFVIHNGTHKVHEPLLEPTSYKPSRPFLFGMGYINRKKNYHVLLPLLEDENIEIVLGGRLDEDDYISGMKITAEKMGVGDRLHLTGPLTEGEKSWYLQNCLAFMQPSLAEGFGAPVVEAMQFGKPLFLSSLTSLPEIGGPHSFYFTNFNADHMRAVFRQGISLFDRENISAKMTERAKMFDWKDKAKEYVSVYKQLSVL